MNCNLALWLNHYTTTTTSVLRPFVQDYLGEPVLEETLTTHTYPGHQPSFISFLHLLWSTASSQFNLHAWQSFCTTSLLVLFGLPLGLEPSTSYTDIFSSSNHCLLFATHAHIIATRFAVLPRLYHPFLVPRQLFTWTLIFYLNITHRSHHSHPCPLKCHLIFFPYRPSLTSMQHTTSHTTAVQSSSYNKQYIWTVTFSL